MGISPFANSNSDDSYFDVPGQMIPDGFGPPFGFSPDTITNPDQHDIQDEKDRKEAEKEAAKRRANEDKNGGKLSGRLPNIFRLGRKAPKIQGSGNTEITNPIDPAPDTDTDPDPYVPNDDVTLRPGYEDPLPTPNPTPPEVIKSPEPAPDSKPPRKERR